MPRAKTPRATTSPKKQVLTMPEVTSTPQIRKASPSANSQTLGLEGQIRQRAYELYQERGCTSGQENEDWLRAEREVLARQNHQQSA
ncbi:MAG: DUF2934 domain-containing protein [Terriglobales bacterium]|jgi:DUF2934 family protein